jgi:PhzF family phenazine biosynthesis protein
MENHPNVDRVAAFSNGLEGGNPAGVVIAEQMPSEAEMQRIAADVGYSETAFAAPTGDDSGSWRVRYFAPSTEVAFCGHASIALGARLAARFGGGTYPLVLNDGRITVESDAAGDLSRAALMSPPTKSGPVAAELLAEALALFGLDASDLDLALPPAIANAGNDHLVLALADRARLAAMGYDLRAGAALMQAHGLTTINLTWAESPRLFHSRNAFAVGGVLEDPATGAAAAALAGYLRDAGWPHGGAIDIIQGEDMGAKSLLRAEISDTLGASIRVSGTARVI